MGCRNPFMAGPVTKRERQGFLFHVVGRALLLEAGLCSPGEKKLPAREARCMIVLV